MVYVFLANGFETIEALTVVDMLRRAEITVQMVSMQSSLQVTSAQRVLVQADVLFEDMKEEKADVYVLPGGVPGTKNLRANETLMQMCTKQYEEGNYIAAICAAPGIFSELGFLKGRKATCYPSFEKQLTKEGATVVREGAVRDDNVITGRGMGTAVAFATEIISVLRGDTVARMVKEAVVSPL